MSKGLFKFVDLLPHYKKFVTQVGFGLHQNFKWVNLLTPTPTYKIYKRNQEIISKVTGLENDFSTYKGLFSFGAFDIKNKAGLTIGDGVDNSYASAYCFVVNAKDKTELGIIDKYHEESGVPKEKIIILDNGKNNIALDSNFKSCMVLDSTKENFKDEFYDLIEHMHKDPRIIKTTGACGKNTFPNYKDGDFETIDTRLLSLIIKMLEKEDSWNHSKK